MVAQVAADETTKQLGLPIQATVLGRVRTLE